MEKYKELVASYVKEMNRIETPDYPGTSDNSPVENMITVIKDGVDACNIWNHLMVVIHKLPEDEKVKVMEYITSTISENKVSGIDYENTQV